MTLAEVLAEAARRFGDRPAVVTEDGWALNYRDVQRLSDRVAAGLRRQGLRAGDVLALMLPSSPEYLVAYLAAAKVGAATAGINPRLPTPQRGSLAEVAAPALVVGTEELLDGVFIDAPAVAVPLADDAQNCLSALHGTDPAASAVATDCDRVVAIVFTSGTTGTPRGAVFTERHLAAIDHLDTADAPWGSGGPMLASTELVHVGVMTKLRWYLRLGATIHLLRRWRPGPALDVISRQRIASVGAIAPQIALLLRLENFDRYDLTAVTSIVAGGAPSPPDLVVEARQRFGAAYSIRYSSTESGGVGTGTAFDAPDTEALHTVGRPRTGVALRIRNAKGDDVEHGHVGTIEIRSPAVMAGYWRAPDATSQTLHSGWLRTGDVGLIDDTGCLRLHGRDSDVYIRGGYNVHPDTVEAALRRHPAVRDVAVVGVGDPVMGEVGGAVVVLRDPARALDLSELRRFAAGLLAHHELPERLLVVEELPRTPLHKIDRITVRRLLTDPSGRPATT